MIQASDPLLRVIHGAQATARAALSSHDHANCALCDQLERETARVRAVATEYQAREARLREALEKIQQEYTGDIRKRVCDTNIAYWTANALVEPTG